jgi:hypothetical protein
MSKFTDIGTQVQSASAQNLREIQGRDRGRRQEVRSAPSQRATKGQRPACGNMGRCTAIMGYAGSLRGATKAPMERTIRTCAKTPGRLLDTIPRVVYRPLAIKRTQMLRRCRLSPAGDYPSLHGMLCKRLDKAPASDHRENGSPSIS